MANAIPLAYRINPISPETHSTSMTSSSSSSRSQCETIARALRRRRKMRGNRYCSLTPIEPPPLRVTKLNSPYDLLPLRLRLNLHRTHGPAGASPVSSSSCWRYRRLRLGSDTVRPPTVVGRQFSRRPGRESTYIPYCMYIDACACHAAHHRVVSGGDRC